MSTLQVSSYCPWPLRIAYVPTIKYTETDTAVTIINKAMREAAIIVPLYWFPCDGIRMFSELPESLKRNKRNMTDQSSVHARRPLSGE